jgi:NAD(P)-dependent dehydrogenase (short-subunit alcohol dehydrogenase family)
MRALPGQVAVVTGASRGLGRAVAINPAPEGAFVRMDRVREEKWA